MNRKTRAWIGSTLLALLLATPTRADHSWNVPDSSAMDRTLGARLPLMEPPSHVANEPLHRDDEPRFPVISPLEFTQDQLGTAAGWEPIPQSAEPMELVIADRRLPADREPIPSREESETPSILQAVFVSTDHASDRSLMQTSAVRESFSEARLTVDRPDFTILGTSVRTVDSLMLTDVPFVEAKHTSCEDIRCDIPVTDLFQHRSGYVIEPRQNLAFYLNYLPSEEHEEPTIPVQTTAMMLLTGLGLVGLTRVRLS